MSIFARRHYVAVARIIRDFHEADAWDTRTLDAITAEFVNVFRADSPRFVPETFERACEPLVMADGGDGR